ncbi:MAG: hypothetical protein AB7G28_09800 [Pirellulales bacterium]
MTFLQATPSQKSTPSGHIRARVCEDILLNVVSSRHDRQAAFELIYRSYLQSGQCAKNDSGMRATPYQLLSTTDLILAKLRGQAISTVSLVRDGALGLPIESLCPEEVALRRASGIRLAEVSSLADRRQGTARFFGLFCELSRLMIQLASKTRIGELLVAVNPQHAPLYRRYLAFEQIGDERICEIGQGFPAIPLSLNFAKAQVERRDCWADLIGEPLPDEILQSCPITAEDRQYFFSVLDSCSEQSAAWPQRSASFGDSEAADSARQLVKL